MPATAFPYPPGPPTGDWLVSLPGEASIGEVLVWASAFTPPAPADAVHYWPLDDADPFVDLVDGWELTTEAGAWSTGQTSLRGDTANAAIAASAVPAFLIGDTGDVLAWPADTAGNGISLACLCYFVSVGGSLKSTLLHVVDNAGTPGELLMGGFHWNAIGQPIFALQWMGGSVGFIPMTGDVPAAGVTTALMVGYERTAGGDLVTVMWRDTNGDSDSTGSLQTHPGSWPPTTGRVRVQTDVVGNRIDELTVYLEPPSTALFNQYCAAML